VPGGQMNTIAEALRQWAAVAEIQSLPKSEEPIQLLRDAADEIARLTRGDFTPEEFQNLCHHRDEKPGCTPEDFSRGCVEYQKKLFGREVALTNLYKWGKFVSHSGLNLNFKIDCDALTTADWDCHARVVAERIKFREVYGIPRGGLRFAAALSFHKTPDADLELAVDDVWTTGRSMWEFRQNFPGDVRKLVGVVLFRRGPATVPNWVHPVFGLNPYFGD
jgi:hypothetical protein